MDNFSNFSGIGPVNFAVRAAAIMSVIGLVLVLGFPAFAADIVPVPDATPEALAYNRDLNLLWIADAVFTVGVPILFLATGWAGAICAWCRRMVGGNWFWTVTFFSVVYAVLVFLIGLPLQYIHEFAHEHAYGLSNQSLGKWAGNTAIQLGVSLIVTAAVMWIPYLLLKRSPKRWWIWSIFALAPILLFIIVASPVWVDPLMNTFEPLKDQQLEAAIQEQATRSGIGDATILERDASTDSKRLGAYVNGLGPSKRIVLFDTLVAKLDQPEILFVVGHETKHYIMNDVWKLFGLIITILVIGLWATDRISRAVIARWHTRLGFTSLADPASQPLLTLCVSLVFILAGPGFNWVSRDIEHEADRYGLEITQNNHAAASAFVKLQEEGLGVPDPGIFQRIFRLDHPALADRIRFANEYHPWEEGKPLVYADQIKPK
jgi:Zn-dependent protease with chaperone function